MPFQIDLDPFERAYVHFLGGVREAIHRTFEEEVQNGLTQKEIAETLGIDPALVSRRLNGPGNITLRTLSELFTAMGREPLSNFIVPERPKAQTSRINSGTSGIVVGHPSTNAGLIAHASSAY